MLRTIEAQSNPLPTADLAASFEQVVVDVLVERSLRCAMDHGLEELVMVGGVAANRRLRCTLQQRSDAMGVRVSVAPLAYCTDNAAMIGAAALLRWESGARGCSWRTGVSARWSLGKADQLYNEQPAF